MDHNPTLFPQTSNRESWKQVITLNDDNTGDPLTLTDTNGNPLYDIRLELIPAGPRGHLRGASPYPYYDDCDGPMISASLADYISILGIGTVQINLPKSKMSSLRSRTYDVFLTLTDTAADDGRQILIGRLPVLYGGRNT